MLKEINSNISFSWRNSLDSLHMLRNQSPLFLNVLSMHIWILSLNIHHGEQHDKHVMQVVHISESATRQHHALYDKLITPIKLTLLRKSGSTFWRQVPSRLKKSNQLSHWEKHTTSRVSSWSLHNFSSKMENLRIRLFIPSNPSYLLLEILRHQRGRRPGTQQD